MAKPAPKNALRKAPAAAHPVAPPMPEPPAESFTSLTAPAAAPTAALPMFSVRMDAALRRRIKRWAAENDTTVQALTTAALSEYLAQHGG